VTLFFVPRHEPNRYVSKTVWHDPMGQEFRVIRKTYDLAQESKKGEERDRNGTMRMHSMPVGELHRHKPGRWKVELFLDGVLARTCPFTVD
jgi:hypothetical protein